MSDTLIDGLVGVIWAAQGYGLCAVRHDATDGWAFAFFALLGFIVTCVLALYKAFRQEEASS